MTSGHIQIEIDGRRYAYDATTNGIVRLSDAVARILDDYLRLDADQLRSKHGATLGEQFQAACDWLDDAVQQNGMFTPLLRKDFSGILEPGVIEDTLNNGLSCLVLGVTEQCNLRCRYCIYSGHYAGERRHRDEFMSFDVARRSIDFFLERAPKSPGPAISFYGGEPLLRGDLVRECVRHVRENWPQRSVTLSVATNLTLLDSDILEFFVANDVNVSVSLDGPAHIHDRSRITREGTGSHETIMGWLRQLRALHPEYLHHRVSISATFDPNDDFDEVFAYFSGPEWVDLSIIINCVKEQDRSSFFVPDEKRERHEKRLEELIARRGKAFQSGEFFNNRLFPAVFKRVFTKMVRRDLTRAQSEEYPNSMCIPGADRLFVDSQGRLYPCEKLDIAPANIGDCNSGFDVGRVRALVGTMVDFCNDSCQDCWAYRLCTHCLVHLADSGTLSPAHKRARCDDERESIRRDIERFILIWESEPPEAESMPSSLRSHVRAYRNSD